MQIFRKLRNLGGYSLILTIPSEIKHAFELIPGDEVVMEIEKDGVKIKFFEAKTNKTEVLREEGEVVEAE
jgi:bifunctional DNA-binding transcriptional regulator/antitoxin component of YhaV-PrlF toxin-antitoxin module